MGSSAHSTLSTPAWTYAVVHTHACGVANASYTKVEKQCSRLKNIGTYNIRIPQLVDVVVVVRSQLAVGLADPVPRAVIGAGRALTRGALVAHKARAGRSASIADSLVGALHVVVRGVGNTRTVGLSSRN